MERARNIITKLRTTLGEENEVCMAGMLPREAWAATTSGIGAAALVLRETRRVTIALPGGAPGAKAASATRQGVTVGRLPISEGDRVALAETAEGATALLKVAAGGEGVGESLGIVLALEAPATIIRRRGEQREETLSQFPQTTLHRQKREPAFGGRRETTSGANRSLPRFRQNQQGTHVDQMGRQPRTRRLIERRKR